MNNKSIDENKTVDNNTSDNTMEDNKMENKTMVDNAMNNNAMNNNAIDKNELLKLSPVELIDLGVCPTCLDRESGNAVYGDNKDILLYKDEDIECLFVKNPRIEGHMCIVSVPHFHDMSEATDYINEKIFRFAKQFMNILKKVYGCERVYLCSMSDGPNNHYHIQLIPRYPFEKRGSENFVKQRKEYVFDEEKFSAVKTMIEEYASNN